MNRKQITKYVVSDEGKKLYKCYVCGGQFYFGLNKNDKRNQDGTIHVCKKESGEEFNQNERREKTKGYSRSRYYRWYWGFGPGARYKAYGYYSQEREQRRKQYREQYNSWRNQYQNKDISIEKACEILELTVDIARKIADNFTKELKIEVRNAYRKLALRFHPDRNHDSDATAKFREITEAYERLTN